MRKTLLLVATILMVACSQQVESTGWPTESWSDSTPEEQGVKAGALERIHQELKRGAYGNVDHFLVVRNGYLVMNEHYDRDYEEINRGQDQDSHPYNYYNTALHPFYQESELHTLQSITKSITTLVIGMAMEQGDFPSLDEAAIEYLGEYEIENKPNKQRITIEDLLTMRSGIFWDEAKYPVGDERNTVTQMEYSDDWIQYVLNLPMSHKPGEIFIYNSGGSQLLSAIFKESTGVQVSEYAEEHLFKPLGIEETYWKKTPKGYTDTEGGLYMKAVDLAKIGYLIVQEGNWEGKQIVSADWIKAMTHTSVEDVDPYDPGFDYGYGYQWWLVDPIPREAEGLPQVYAGFGYGNQRLLVVPDLNLVVVFYAWNIYGPAPSTIDLFLEEILPAIN